MAINNVLDSSEKYNKRPLSKCPAATVYIDGLHILAKDANDSVIVSGVAGNDDAKVIQTAINRVSKSDEWASSGQILANGTFASVVKISDTEYHMYYHHIPGVGGERAESIHHAIASAPTGPWTNDVVHNPVLSPTGTETSTGVPNVWKEGNDWYMIYRYSASGAARIGLATSSDGLAWRRSNANPILSLDEGCIGPFEMPAIIKVGGTYYGYFNETSNTKFGGRAIGVATSDDLTTWTRHMPVFVNHRFCPGIFKVGSKYYLLVSKHGNYRSEYAFFELWSCHNPLFPAADRTFEGIVKTVSESGWDSYRLDCPHVLTSDITRTLNSFDELCCYYSGMKTSDNATWTEGVMVENTVAAALEKARVNGRGLVSVLPGNYTVPGNALRINAPLSFDFHGAHIHAENVAGQCLVDVQCPECIIQGGILETTGPSAGQTMRCCADKAVIKFESRHGSASFLGSDCNVDVNYQNM